jgi:hypothetical protein
MAYIVIRNIRTGYVSLVKKGRDDHGNVKTKAYICGLGTMSIDEFKAFQKWAHSMKDQEYRKAMVLSSGKAITTKEKVDKIIIVDKQKKTTVKKAVKEIKEVSEKDKQKARVLREKEWFKTLTLEQQKEYKEKQQKRLIEDQKELQKKFRKIGKSKNIDEKITTYEIDNLTQVQKYESEIKTLKGDAANKFFIIERERKIKNILGNKYISGKEVMIAYKKGNINIVDNGKPIKGV